MKAFVIIGIMSCRLDSLGYVAREEDDKMRKKGLEHYTRKRQGS
jgi:hypothetical protein